MRRLLSRPHSRTTRTPGWIATRLIAYPLFGIGLTVTAIGFTNPDALHGEYVDGVRVVVSR